MLSKTFFKMMGRGIAVLCAVVFFSGTALAAERLLADKHEGDGVTCAQCHKEKTPTRPAKSTQCESCHGNNDAMAKKTAKIKPNPHFNHLGDVACTECHHVHKPSELMCNTCHKFEMKTP